MKKSPFCLVLVWLMIACGSSGCVTSTSFQEWRGPDEFLGQGGICRAVDGIDIWENGSPPRRYKILGVVDATVVSKAIFMAASGGHSSHLDARLAKEAKKHGGDAVILIQADSNIFDSSNPRSGPYVAMKERFLVVRYLETEPEELLGKEDYQDTFGKRHYALKEETPAEQIRGNCDLEIRELLAAEKHVALCVNISEPNNTCPLSRDKIENWKKAMTNELGNFFENVVFSSYNQLENFTLVDRNNLINVLKEHQLSQSGLINKETRITAGKLIGINYMADIAYNRHCVLPRVNDTATIKLIAIETGKIMAVDTIEYLQAYNSKSRQLEIIRTRLNGQEVVVGPDGKTLYRKQNQ